jgi:tetratricopeptide (TPR) repeat protein
MAYTNKPEPEGKDLSRGGKRRWVVPPAVVWDANIIDGLRLLDDPPVPPELRLTLFYAFRAVQLWGLGDIPAQELFREAADGLRAPQWFGQGVVPPELERPLHSIRALIEGEESTEAGLIAACTEIGQWGYILGAAATESSFFLLVARMRPEDPEAAFLVARAARRDQRLNAAEEWFRRTIALARRKDDDASYVAGYLGWGVLEQIRGRAELARRRFTRAWRKARSVGLKEMMAAARHYLVALAVGRSFNEGYRHAVAAYKLYGPGEFRLGLLAIDTGAFLIDNGYFSAAIPLLSAAVVFPGLTRERKVAVCNLARAVAAVGDRERFLALWLEVYTGPLEQDEALAAALTELACGAMTLGQPRRAEEALRDALSVSLAEASRRRAEALLAQVWSAPPGDTDTPAPPEVLRFVRRFAKRVRRMAAPG